MPNYLKRKQFIADSTRAYYYFNLRKDSSYIKKYLKGHSIKTDKPNDTRSSVDTLAPKNVSPDTLNAVEMRQKKANPRQEGLHRGMVYRREEIWYDDHKRYIKQITG